MKHKKIHPENNRDNQESRLTRALGVAATKSKSIVDALDRSGNMVFGSDQDLANVRAELTARNVKGANLAVAEKHTSSLTDLPIALARTEDGKDRGLLKVFMMGRSAVGVVTTKQPGKKEVETVDVMVLPFGVNRFNPRGGQNVVPVWGLAHINTADLEASSVNGQAPEDVVIKLGRDNIRDEFVSAAHLSLTIRDGSIDVMNTSMTNPTSELNGHSFIATQEFTGNKVGPTEAFCAYLNDNVMSWAPSTQVAVPGTAR